MRSLTGLLNRKRAGKTEFQASSARGNFAGMSKNKAFSSQVFCCGRHEFQASSKKAVCAGKTEFQASSRCGEALYTTYIFFPRNRVVTGVGRDGLTAQPAQSPPPPRDKGQKGE